MSRYLGPRLKIQRSLGVELPGLTRKTMERRPYPPGQHRGQNRRKLSVFGKQLREKQKLRFHYGLTERKLRTYVRQAFKARQDPGNALLSLIESRLDNLVFRAGFAPTIPAARQLVSHGHILVDGRKLDIPSASIKPTQSIALTEAARNFSVVQSSLEEPTLPTPEWLQLDAQKGSVSLKALPPREAVPFPLEVKLVVEFYARRL